MTGTAVHDRGFSRRHRLSESRDFDLVFRNGKRSADRYFTILYRANGLDCPRLGFAVAKKRVRSAVGRNRLRRLTKESFRMAKDRLGAVDIVVMVRAAAGTADNRAIFASLEHHWQRMEHRGREQENH